MTVQFPTHFQEAVRPQVVLMDSDLERDALDRAENQKIPVLFAVDVLAVHGISGLDSVINVASMGGKKKWIVEAVQLGGMELLKVIEEELERQSKAPQKFMQI